MEQALDTHSCLETLGNARFGPLREAERRLLRAAPRGKQGYCGPDGMELSAPENNPEHADQWPEEREVRATLLRWLCVDPVARAQVHSSGIWLTAARLDDRLTLSFVKLLFPLRIVGCWLPKGMALDGAKLPGLTLTRSWIGDPTLMVVRGTQVPAILADFAQVTGMALLDGMHAQAEVRLLAAEIGASLDCRGASLNNSGGTALNAEGVKIGGGVHLSNGFVAEGEVRLYRAQTGGSLICDGGKFKNRGKRALYVDGAKIGGGAHLGNGFVAEGEVRLYRAQTGGSLICDGGKFKNRGKSALYAVGAKIGRGIYLRDGFLAEGKVTLSGAETGGNLNCNGGSLEGDLWLYGTSIGGNLDLSGAKFAAKTPVRLRVVGTDIKGALKIHSLQKSPNTEVRISDTSCAVLDDKLEAWPDRGRLDLDGFAYCRIRDTDNPQLRLDWLRRQLPVDTTQHRGAFRPQPYRQLAQVLRAQGEEAEARMILIGMAQDRRKYARLGWLSWLSAWVSWHVMRNGYQPLRAAAWLFVLWIVSGFVFGVGYDAGLMGPTDQKAFDALVANHGAVPDWYPSFRTAIYAIDISLPIISLGERDKWQPLGRPVDPKSRPPTWLPDALAIWRWIAIVAGWFLASMLVAGVTGLVAKE